MKRSLLLGGVLVATTLILGCSGGSGGGGSGASNEALLVANRVNVVDADQEAVQDISVGLGLSIAPLMAGFKAVTDLPGGSDYNTDPVNVFVEERSAESFDRINEILCSMAQTGYDLMINQGPYKAQINISECSSSKDSTSSAGESAQNQSSSSTRTEFQYWTVNSYRNTGGPHTVDVWIHEAGSDHDPAKLIMARTEISESVSSENPLGIFQVNFMAYPVNDAGEAITDGEKSMHGFIKTERDTSGDVLLKYYSTGGFGDEFSYSERVTLYKNPDGTTGSGSTVMEETEPSRGTRSKSFNLAYNDAFFYRMGSDGSNAVCLDRNDYDTSSWRYGLYYNENYPGDPGGKVSVMSGFPIRYESGEESYHGWADYYGIWFPNNVTLTNGMSVTREELGQGGDNTDTPYTVFLAQGKLRKNTKQELTLGELAGVPLSWNRCTQAGENWTCGDYRVKWNSDSNKLVMDATRNQETNWTWQDLAGGTQDVVFDDNMWDFSFYAESLGGDGRIKIFNSEGTRVQPNSQTVVIFHRQETMYPGDTLPETLVCFENCPDPSIINQQDPFYAESSFGIPWDQTFTGINQGVNGNPGVAPGALADGVNYIGYTFDPETMLLKRGANAIMQTDNANNMWGIRTGAMVEPENLVNLACEWDPDSTCSFRIWDEVDVFYTWESGVDNWNQLIALKDASNEFVSFDPPLMIEYAHTNGAKYYLQYNGFDVWGIPGKCVDMDTGDDTECYDQGGEKAIRWVPEFAIAAGSPVSGVGTGTQYYLKPLDVEMRMKATEAANCSDAGLSTTSYDLPDESEYVEPTISDEPVVNTAPAVIGGELQTAL